ncbi:MAG: T9SS type A sorting domain-containing protein, partial [Chitinophagaceae bacterium]
QLSYRFSGNFENNLFLDDINLRTQVLPTKLKNEGYLVLPNPFSNSFAVWHYQTPTNLRYINVFSSSGQLVWSKQYNGNAQRYIQIDLSKNTAGIYSVMLGYDDSNRNITVPVIKLR